MYAIVDNGICIVVIVVDDGAADNGDEETNNRTATTMARCTWFLVRATSDSSPSSRSPTIRSMLHVPSPTTTGESIATSNKRMLACTPECQTVVDGSDASALAHQLIVSAARALGISIAPIAALTLNYELLLRGWNPEAPRALGPKLAQG
jgi:hypothetical protein